MVLRTFSAADNQAMQVADGSPFGTAGDAIINNSSTADGTVFVFTGGYQDHQITLDDTSSDTSVFEDDLAGNHVIVDGKGIVADGAQVESESLIYIRALDDSGDPTGPTITLTVFSQGGSTSDIWGFASDTPLVDGAQYVKVGGSNIGDSSYSDFEEVDGVPCFAAGTLIKTPRGARRVETLTAGDVVITADRGGQPVLWATSTQLTLTGQRAQQPVLIKAGALGPDLPQRDLAVSPQHRILIRSGPHEVFVPARALIHLPGIRVMHGKRFVEYVHVLLRPHAVLFSEGLASESFFPGPMALAALGTPLATDLRSRFCGTNAFAQTCRPALRMKEARRWLQSRSEQLFGVGDAAVRTALPA